MRVVKVIMLVDGDNRYDDKILAPQSPSFMSSTSTQNVTLLWKALISWVSKLEIPDGTSDKWILKGQHDLYHP